MRVTGFHNPISSQNWNRVGTGYFHKLEQRACGIIQPLLGYLVILFFPI